MRIVRQSMLERASESSQLVEIAHMDRQHVPGVVGLQRLCFPVPFPADQLWTVDHLTEHIKLFPQGQFVALRGDAVIGSASSLVISEDSWSSHSSWEETCGGFEFRNHTSSGSTLYGADISIHPDWRGRGIGRCLYQARFELVKDMNLSRFGTTCRIPGYRDWSRGKEAESVDNYCVQVAAGLLTDRTMTPLLRFGLEIAGVSYDHMKDPESGDAAAILEWKP